MLIQIYEIQTPQEAEQMIALGVDHIGSVVLDRDNWRDPTLREAVRLTAGTDARSSLIPLFSDVDAVSRLLDYYRPDIVHFCENLIPEPGLGPEAPGGWGAATEKIADLQRFVRDKFPDVKITRSLPIPAAAMPRAGLAALVEMFAPVSDFFMTDTLLTGPGGAGGDAAQPVTGFVGITGMTCDWEAAAWLVRTSPLPVILAGGLGPENAAAAIARVQPAGVDSCTRTNAVDAQGRPIRFRKDISKVRDFVATARRAAATIGEPLKR
jgi:phosphoribosylanthranilate isomerase